VFIILISASVGYGSFLNTGDFLAHIRIPRILSLFTTGRILPGVPIWDTLANKYGIALNTSQRILPLLAGLFCSLVPGAPAQALGADLLILDSIQTVYTDLLEGAPGNVGQVRECAARLMRFAKESGAAVIVVGHVTKGGGIAGPKTLEHIVDTVLYFEGEATLDHRLLRATKNRFGPVDEIGVFTMSEHGLVPVANPSALFLAARAANVSGSAVTALMEGTRPVLVEVQALAARAGYGTPQRVATGLDPRRLAVLLAVLERRAGISFADLDVFVQATAGVRLVEPGADMAIAAALLSSLNNRPAPADALFLGEIGLGGEIRPTAGLERRVAEAARLGFTRVFGATQATLTTPGVTFVRLEHIGDLARALAA
jgi:DNA repair protein RadA/Sms